MFINRHKHLVNKFFLIFIVLVDFWVLCNFLSHTKFEKLALLGAQLGIIGPALLAPILLIFAYIIYNGVKSYQKRKKILFLTFIPSIVLCLFTFSHYNVKKFEVTLEGNFFTPGVLYYYLLSFLIVCFITAFYYLIKAYKKFEGIKRLQIKYVVFSWIFTVIIAIIFTAILPLFDINRATVVGPFSVVFFIAFTSYSILRYRFLDVRIAARKIFIYFVITTFLYGILYFTAWIYNHFLGGFFSTAGYFSGLVIAPIFVIIFYSLNKVITKFANKYLFYSLYSYQETVVKLTNELNYFVELDKIINTTTNTIKQTMQLDRVEILFISNQQKQTKYKIAKTIGFNKEGRISLIKKDFLTQTLRETQKPLVKDELVFMEQSAKHDQEAKNFRELFTKMTKIEASICLPLISNKKLIGIIILGQKISKDVYTKEDIELLDTLSKQVAIAIENALLYKEAQDFNAKLRREIAKATRELRVANKELKQLDKVKTEFISIASHQLRTPLTAVKGFVSLIVDGSFGKVPKDIRETMGKVFNANERLIKLVDDLLDLSRIEAGRITFEFAKNDPAEMIKETIDNHKLNAERKGLKLTFKKPQKKIRPFVFDRDKIHEALSNLVDNAIKYTEKGGVTVSLEEGKNNIIKFVVADTGVGLSKDEINRIFKKFQRGDKSSQLNVSGLGIGLYIGQKMAHAHGGRINVESDGPGKGSRFIIELKNNLKEKKIESK